MSERGSLTESRRPGSREESWVLIERYVPRYPHEWMLVFKRGETILEVLVPEDVWRAFDGIKV